MSRSRTRHPRRRRHREHRRRVWLAHAASIDPAVPMPPGAPSSQPRAWQPRVPACAQCHAYNGGSDGSGAFPRIAGQSPYYLDKQMRDFASGVQDQCRHDADRQGTVARGSRGCGRLLRKRREPLPALGECRSDAGQARRSNSREIGDAAKNLQSCDDCHGPGGAGEPPAIPYLAGQYAHYIAFQLKMWQRGFRKSSPDAMEDIAKRLDEQDIAAVAAYFQQVARALQRHSQRSDRHGIRRTADDSAPAPGRAHRGSPPQRDEAAQALSDGPIGAYIVAGIAVALLFIGWLAFYFLLFLPRGAIG